METNKIQKQLQRCNKVLILPMRNGNQLALHDVLELALCVLILPMRNGNFLIPFSSVTYLCSYPTYEEWKLYKEERSKKQDLGSYPTYEEWKQLKLKIAILCLQSSYPTYEEWKHEGNRKERNTNRRVLILPMRNGNIEIWLARRLYNIVLILPMRNKKQTDAHIARLYNL